MDPIKDVMSLKLKMEQIGRDFQKSKDQIEQLDHLHMEEIKEWIELPLNSQMKINLFLHEWKKIKKMEFELLICKAQF